MRTAPASIQVCKDEMILRSDVDKKDYYELPINRLMSYISCVLYCSAVLQKFPIIYTYNQQFPTLTGSEYFRVIERDKCFT